MEVVKPISRKPDHAEKHYSKLRENSKPEEPKAGITVHDAWGGMLFTARTWEISKARAEAREYNLAKAGVGQYAAFLRCYGKDYAV